MVKSMFDSAARQASRRLAHRSVSDVSTFWTLVTPLANPRDMRNNDAESDCGRRRDGGNQQVHGHVGLGGDAVCSSSRRRVPYPCVSDFWSAAVRLTGAARSVQVRLWRPLCRTWATYSTNATRCERVSIRA